MGLTFKVEQKNQSMKAGIFLAFIDNIKLHKNNDGTPQLTASGEGLITVTYANNNNQKIDKTYLIGTEKQKTFDRDMMNANINTSENNSVKSAIGKRIYIAIREEAEFDENGEKIGETSYYVFKTFKFIEGGNKPAVMGDPEKNNGIASAEFVNYRQVRKNNNPLFEPTHQVLNGVKVELPIDLPKF